MKEIENISECIEKGKTNRPENVQQQGIQIDQLLERNSNQQLKIREKTHQNQLSSEEIKNFDAQVANMQTKSMHENQNQQVLIAEVEENLSVNNQRLAIKNKEQQDQNTKRNGLDQKIQKIQQVNQQNQQKLKMYGKLISIQNILIILLFVVLGITNNATLNKLQVYQQKLSYLQGTINNSSQELKLKIEQKYKDLFQKLKNETIEIEKGFHNQKYYNIQLREILQRYKQKSLKQKLVEAVGVENWGSLINKQKLDLQRKGLTELPNAIGQLINLRALYLSNNDLRVLPQSMSRLKLQLLLIGGNQQLLSLPKWLFNMHSLQLLQIDRIGLEELPQQIGSLTNLQILNLSGNKLVKLPHNITKLVNLFWLHIQQNPITEYPPNFFQQLTKITTLYAHKTKIMQLPPTNILKQLKEFGLTLTKQHEIAFNNFPFGDMPQLEFLCIHQNKYFVLTEEEIFRKLCDHRNITLTWVNWWQ